MKRVKIVCGIITVTILGFGYSSYKIKNEDLFARARNEYTMPIAASLDELNKPININTAGLDELQKLDGIGEVFAQRIIDYRDKNGSFGNIEDIKNVKGIGDKTFQKIKDKIVCE